MRVRALVAVFLLGVAPWAAPSLAGPPVEDALRICRSDPVFGDTLRMSVKYELMKSQGSEPDEADVDEVAKVAENTEITKCLTRLSEDPSIFRALNNLSGSTAEFGWDAWRHQCKDVVGPKGPCIEAEARAGEEIMQSNQERTSQTVSFICEHLLEQPSATNGISTKNRTWLECLKIGLKAKPTVQALQSCKFLSASAETRGTDALVRCFRDRAK